ncbi:DUF397 domain-containing protein [Streptomyces sp. XM4193]|uniref:DUF397 domain-containing protein n=1 Tax=Streptomyces sp. XM4193 TaxID=2929782 RepID=UPI001FF806AD|nr:DUF397 domain-containing protein [Streptomyces sp. XM4193]MCK1795787.1 DUF397 domain-containing protein [Streptomyces sp. XM4193]
MHTHHLRVPPLTWRKSSHSNADGGDCLEVADYLTGVLPVRDSKRPTGPVLVFPADNWNAFVSAIKTGGFSG